MDRGRQRGNLTSENNLSLRCFVRRPALAGFQWDHNQRGADREADRGSHLKLSISQRDWAANIPRSTSENIASPSTSTSTSTSVLVMDSNNYRKPSDFCLFKIWKGKKTAHIGMINMYVWYVLYHLFRKYGFIWAPLVHNVCYLK